MAENLANDFATTLAGAVDNSTGTLTVVLASGAPAPNFRIRVDDELMLVTAVAGTTWTVTRGIEGTAAASHASGAVVVHVLTAGALAALLAALGVNPTFTGDLTLSSVGARIRGDFSNATAINMVAFQSSVPDGRTVIPVLPNGVSKSASHAMYNGTDPANAQRGFIGIDATRVYTGSNYSGSPGVALPYDIDVGGVNRARILPTGEVGIGVTPAVGQGTLQVPDINGGQIAGSRRRNFNGNFDVWQRGDGPFTASGYTADGWVLSVGAGASVAVSKATFVAGDYYGTSRPEAVLRFSQTVAGSASCGLINKIPGLRQFGNKTITISFWAACAAGSIAATIQTSRVYGSGGSAQEYGTPLSCVITTTRQKFTYQIAIPSLFGKTLGAGNCLWAFFTFPIATQDAYISEFQVEYGTVATPFEQWDASAEQAACQRWFRKHQVWIPASSSRASFPLDMAATPTISGGGAGFNSTDTDKNTLAAYQTTAASQTLTFSCEP